MAKLYIHFTRLWSVLDTVAIWLVRLSDSKALADTLLFINFLPTILLLVTRSVITHFQHLVFCLKIAIILSYFIYILSNTYHMTSPAFKGLSQVGRF